MEEYGEEMQIPVLFFLYCFKFSNRKYKKHTIKKQNTNKKFEFLFIKCLMSICRMHEKQKKQYLK